MDRAIAQAEQVPHIVLIEPPRLFGALARELIDRALDIAGRKIDQRFCFDRRIARAACRSHSRAGPYS